MSTHAAQLARELRTRLGASVDYMESQLTAGPDLDEAARRSGFSPSHFMRLFHAATGLSVGQYVRLRRLSLAAEALARGQPVLETALACGYESQATFTRAFSRQYGVSPAAYARGLRAGAPPVDVLVPYEPRLLAEGGAVLGPRRAERAAFRLVGIEARLPVRGGQAIATVPALWADWYAGRRWEALGAGAAAQPMGLSRLRASGELEYVIGLEVAPGAPAPAGYRAVQVPGGPYSLLWSEGEPAPTSQALILAAYGRPVLDPELRRRPEAWDLEAFHFDRGLPPGAMRCELWVPLRR